MGVKSEKRSCKSKSSCVIYLINKKCCMTKYICKFCTYMYRISSVIRRVFFSFQNNPKDLDPSYKTDLGLWGRLGKVKFVLQQNFKGLI